jgi:hypothetical protein
LSTETTSKVRAAKVATKPNRLTEESLPEPHQLDFDWRFSEETTNNLAELLSHHARVLILGAPSVASILERADSSDVLLIDRQPLQTNGNHLALDPGRAQPLGLHFDTALIDGPWYPTIYRRWITWAARHLNPDGEIIASLWLESTRPNASKERDELFKWLKTWASFTLKPEALHYTTPLFELETARGCMAATPGMEWRKGDLLRIHPFREITLPEEIPADQEWVRFILDDYQIALRVKPDDGRAGELTPVQGACGWIWPSVSRRFPGYDSIDLWSSRNEVASIRGYYDILKALRLIKTSNGQALRDGQSPLMRALSQWAIPIGPYWRTHEWTHHG